MPWNNAFVEFEEDDSASVAVFWGEGGAFCSGWDLKNAALLNSAEPFDERNIPKDEGISGNGTDIPPAFLGATRLKLSNDAVDKHINANCFGRNPLVSSNELTHLQLRTF